VAQSLTLGGRAGGLVRGARLLLAAHRAGPVALAGDGAGALAVLERAAGIEPGDYASTQALRRRLDTATAGVPADLAAGTVLALSGALGMVRRTGDGLAVGEAYLRVDDSDRGDLARMRGRLRERLASASPALQASLLLGYAGMLAVVGRESESVALVWADLDGVEPGPVRQGDPRALAHLADVLTARLADLPPDVAALYLSFALPLLEGSGAATAALAAAEAHLGLAAGDYRPAARLDARLTRWRRGLSTAHLAAGALAVVVLLLHGAGRMDDGLALLEWWAGIDAADYADDAALRRRWQDAGEDLPPDVPATLRRTWISSLADLGRRRDALAVVRADAGLAEPDLADPDRFGPALERRLAGFRVDTRDAYVLSLAQDLATLGLPGEAAAITDWYLRRHERFWTVPDAGDPGLRHVVPLVESWLAALLAAPPAGRGDDPHEAVLLWDLADQAVRHLRRGLRAGGSAPADRRAFVDHVELLRRRVIEVGDRWTRLPDPSPQDRERIVQAQLWGAELGQRVLVERFLLTRARSDPDPDRDAHPDRDPEADGAPGRPAVPRPVEGWPLDRPRPTGVIGHLPVLDRDAEDAALRLLLRRRGTARTRPDAVADVPVVGAEPPEERWSPEERWPPEEPWLPEAEALIRRGVDEDLLAGVLGPDAVLLRASAGPAGELTWVALGAADGGLRLLAHAAGRPGDLARVHWAVLRHDVGLLMACAVDRLDRSRGPSPDRSPDRSPDATGDQVARAVLSAVDALRAAADPVTDADAVLAGLAAASSLAGEEALAARLGALLTPTPATGPDAEVLDRELALLGDAARAHLATGTGRRAVLAEIDAVTERFCAQVAAVWRLEPLVPALGRHLDLVLQLDAVLHAVPVAHLPLPDGRPLHAAVRSTRVSLCALLSVLQGRLDRDVEIGRDRLLVLSHFPDTDPGEDADPQDDGEDGDAETCAAWLHHGQDQIGARSPGSPLRVLHAGRRPPATAALLEASVAEGYQVVSVCGDGGAAGGGIELADGLWSGDGGSWREVGLLVLVSCSVGRLQQVEDQDVEGLCVRLALRRARSVVACRWPVNALEAVAFANEIVAQYWALRGRARLGLIPPQALRARAVAEARRQLLHPPGGAPRTVGLHTMAAFDLYGNG